MATESVTVAAATAEVAVNPRPYPPSWVHRAVKLIDRAPGSPLLVYALLTLVASVGMHLVAWSLQPVAPQTIDLGLVYFGALPAALLWSIGYLERQAGRSFDAFRPALTLSESAQARLRYELSVTPALPSLVITLVVFAFTGTNYVLDPVGSGSAGMGLPALLFRFVVEAANVALLFLLIYQLVRQMRQIRRTLARSVVVNVFQPGPIHAFSRLTSRAGIVIVALIAPTLLTNPVPADVTPEQFLVNWAPYTFLPPLIALVAFVVPLYGLHDRLVDEKERLQGEAEARLQAVLAEVDRSVDRLDYTNADGLGKTLSSVLQQREVLAKIHTWPWSMGTLRGFVSAILLPLFLFVVQLVIGRAV